MADIIYLYLGGLAALVLGFVLYGGRERSTRPPSHFRCVHHVTASGEPISVLLSIEA
ncbi:hypothetical protein NSND_61665 [Nitrospira sp. ND1]|nr:hypothetical protein NSND_61665 [Nitrospira sp. ND1]